MLNDSLPSVSDLLNNATSSLWLRRALQEALSNGMEPSEAARDAQLLAAMLEHRARIAQTLTTHCLPLRVPTVDIQLPLSDSEGVVLDFPAGISRFLSPSQWIAPPIQRISKESI